MPKITWEDKTNPHPIIDRTKQATAEDFRDTKTSVNAIYDGVLENYYAFKGASEFEEGTLFYSVVNGRNESKVPFYAPTLTSDVGTIELGGAITIKVGGENTNFTDEIDNQVFNPVWIKQGVGNKPFARLTPEEAETIEYELSKADVLVNPVWTVGIVDSHRTIGYSVEVDTTITNCTFFASKSGVPFWQANFGTLVAGVEKFIDLVDTTGLTTVDVLTGQSYSLTITSPDGDVRLKGSAANDKPFFVATVLPFYDKKVPTDDEVNQRQIIRSGVKGEFSVGAINSETSVHLFPDIGPSFTVFFNSNSVVDNEEGIEVEVFDQSLAVENSVTARKFFVSVDSGGTIAQELVKTPSTSVDKVHLYEYIAISGILFAGTLKANPYLSSSDKTYQGMLNSEGTRVTGLDIGSTEDGTLGIKTTNFDLIGNSVNYEASKLDPHVKTIPGEDPQSWTYLPEVSPGITSVLLDPTQYNNNGTLTSVDVNQATVQLVLIENDGFVILRGETLYANYDTALLNINLAEFSIPEALFEAIEVGRIAIKGDATDSDDENEVAIKTEMTGTIGVVTPDTPAGIKAKLETLTGVDRLDASAVKNIPVDTATTDELRGSARPNAFNDAQFYPKFSDTFHLGVSWVARDNLTPGPFDSANWVDASLLGAATELVVLDSESIDQQDQIDTSRGGSAYPKYQTSGVSYAKDEYIHELTGGADYRAKQAITAPAGVFNPLLWQEASLSALSTPESSRDMLQELVGVDRLDASAVKNINTQHTDPVVVPDANNSSIGWFDVIVWNDRTTLPTSYDFDITIQGTNDLDFVGSTTLRGSGTFGLSRAQDDHILAIIERISTYQGIPDTTRYRVIQDSNNTTDKIRLQIYFGAPVLVNIVLINNLTEPYTTETNFGTFDAWVTGSEITLTELYMTDWEEHNIHQGTTGGTVTESVGLHGAGGGHISFGAEDVTLTTDGSKVLIGKSKGTQFLDGTYGTYAGLAKDGEYLNGTVILPLDVIGNEFYDDMLVTGTTSFMVSGLSGIALTPQVGDGSAKASFNIAGVSAYGVGKVITISTYVRKSAASTTTNGWQLKDDVGTIRDSVTWADAETGYAVLTFDHTITTVDVTNDFVTFVINDGGFAGANWNFFLGWEVKVVLEEPVLQAGIAFQFDSAEGAVLLPDIGGVNVGGTDTAEHGAIARGGRNQDMIVGNQDGTWNTVNNEFIDLPESSGARFYAADFGNGEPITMGWTNTGDPQVVDGVLGFPKLLNFVANNDAIRRLGDAAFWQTAYDYGFRWDNTFIFDPAAPTGSIIQFAIEPPTSNQWGFNGRWIANGETTSATTFAITGPGFADIDGFSRDELHVMSQRVEAGSQTVRIYIDDVLVATVGMDGGNNRNQLFVWNYGTPNNYLLSSNFFAIHTEVIPMTQDMIGRNDHIIIPAINNAMSIEMPYGNLPIGSRFSVTNGSSQQCHVGGVIPNKVLINGADHFDIPANKKVFFEQTSWPFGNSWTVTSGKEGTEHTLGHILSLSIQGTTGNILKRAGNYTDDDVVVTHTAVGRYDIAIGGHILPLGTILQASSNHNGGGNTADELQSTAHARIGGLGEVAIWSGYISGALQDWDFTVTVEW